MGRVSVAVRWKLLDRLYAHNRLAPIDAVQIVVTGVLLWARTGRPWEVLWCAASLSVLGARLLLSRAYRKCGEDDDPALWAARFAVGAWSASALWGALGALFVTMSDPVVHLIVAGSQWGHLCAVYTRNSSAPRTAFGQVCIVKIPLALACFATLTPVYAGYGLCVVLGTFVARRTIGVLHGQTLGLLNANEQIAINRDELERANQRLEQLVTTDALTGMVNRRGFDIAVQREWRRALREQQPISLLLLDLDYFKSLNDTLGHQAGDECLRRVAESIQSAIRRPVDVATRYGGEEFAIVLPDTDTPAAQHMAERVRSGVEALGILHPASPMGVVTISVGLATTHPDGALVPALLIQQADAALYRAKASGRNRTAVWDPGPVLQEAAAD